MGVEHDISTPPGELVCTPLRPTPLALWDVLEQEVQQMLRLGVVQESNSPWHSPPNLVPKSDGLVQFCTNFRRLNEVLSFDTYSDALMDRVGDAQVLSPIDLTKGYWPILLAEGAQSTWNSCLLPKSDGQDPEG